MDNNLIGLLFLCRMTKRPFTPPSDTQSLYIVHLVDRGQINYRSLEGADEGKNKLILSSWHSSVGRVSDRSSRCITDAGSIPRCGKPSPLPRSPPPPRPPPPPPPPPSESSFGAGCVSVTVFAQLPCAIVCINICAHVWTVQRQYCTQW